MKKHQKKSQLLKVGRNLETLVNMGLVRKTAQDGVDLYSLTYAKRARELIEQGVEIHEAYSTAIIEQAPNIDQEGLIKIVVEHVHGNKGRHDSKVPRKTFTNRVPAA